MLKLRRLNMDTSWQLSWGQTNLLIDPWLVGTEIDGFAWFNEQWHTTAPREIHTLENYQAILISQPFSDHCHEETIRQLKEVPLLVNPKSRKRLLREFEQREMLDLPLFLEQNWMKFGELEIAYLKSPKVFSAAFDAVLIRKGKELVVYCPHGFEFTNTQVEALSVYQTKALIAGFSSFKLPFFLGGVVNPGKSNVLDLVKALKPEKVFHTHDENKASKGIVKKIATVVYQNEVEMKKGLEEQFVFLGADYEWYSVG
jgi:hypothetical protein